MQPADLVHYREALGLSQRQLARELGVSSAAVSRWEDGLRPIPQWLPRYLALYADAERRDAS